MLGGYLHYGLLVALAIALLVAAATDWRRRQIDNWLNAGIALAAPLFWRASGYGLARRRAAGSASASPHSPCSPRCSRFEWMGGGDVKLLTALALWIEPEWFLRLLIVMALVGGVLTIVMGAWHIARRQRDRLAIPYGVAIATRRTVGPGHALFARRADACAGGVNLILTVRRLTTATIPARGIKRAA